MNMPIEPRWLPIESAPRDGKTWVLAHRHGWTLPEIAVWSWHGYWQTMESSIEPTHWMPLPAPPAGETED